MAESFQFMLWMQILIVFPCMLSEAALTEQDAAYWEKLGKETLNQILRIRNVEKPAKNVIMFLGDGMGLPTITAMRIYEAQLRGKSGEESLLSFEKFPNVALSKTYNVDKQVSDSAATATAYLCGIKANYATIGVSAKVSRDDCAASLLDDNQVSSILQWAQAAGKDTGFVTTTRVTHASPAGLYAHVANRDWEADVNVPANKRDCVDIARQLIEFEPGRRLKVIMGGGSMNFLPNSTDGGVRTDDRNLIDAWKEDKRTRLATFSSISTADELENLNVAKTDYLLGLFNLDHLTYVVDKQNKTADVGKGEPSIARMTKKAIEMLQKSGSGYFLFVEGGKIDLAHHVALAKKALTEGVEFNEAIKVALEVTNEDDTLIVVTADHSHTMTINGYPSRGHDILGVIMNATDAPDPYKDFTTLMYTNGPGYRLPPPNGSGIDISGQDTTADDYHQLSAVPKKYETHGGEDVVIYARGPMAHLFRGVVEQNYIPHAMSYAGCYTSGNPLCNTGSASGLNVQYFLLVGSLIVAMILPNLHSLHH